MAARRPSKGASTPSVPVPKLQISISDERQWPSLQQACAASGSRRRSRSAKATVRARAKSQPPILRASTDGKLVQRMSNLTISTEANECTDSAASMSGPIFTPRVEPEMKKPARARVSFGEDIVMTAQASPVREMPVSRWTAKASAEDQIAPPVEEPQHAHAPAEDTGGTADQEEMIKCTEGDTGSEKTAVQTDQDMEASKGGDTSPPAPSARPPSPAKQAQKALPPRNSSMASRVSDAANSHFVDWLEERPASLRMGILQGMGWEYPLTCSEKRELIMLDLAGETMTQREQIEEKESTIDQLLRQRRRMQENMATANGARNSSSSNSAAACMAGGA